MTNTTVLTTDMAILVGIFLLGLLAKLFPRTRNRERARSTHGKLRMNQFQRLLVSRNLMWLRVISQRVNNARPAG